MTGVTDSVTRGRKAQLASFLSLLHSKVKGQWTRSSLDRTLKLWCYVLFHRRSSSGHHQLLKRRVCNAYLRHLRQAWIRHPRLASSKLPDPSLLPWWRDLRTHAVIASRLEPANACTPLSPQQMLQAFRAAAHSRTLQQALVILYAVGAARFQEMRHPRSSIRMLNDCYEITVFPKGGRDLKTASIPRSPIIDATFKMIPGASRLPITTLHYRTLYNHMKKAALVYNWPKAGKWASYSIRHGAFTTAFMQGSSEPDVRMQTGHARRIPHTYLKNHNPFRKVQLQVVSPVLRRIQLLPSL